MTPDTALTTLLDDIETFMPLNGSQRCLLRGAIVEHLKPFIKGSDPTVPIPYAYTLARPQQWDPQCFPTLDAAVAYVINAGRDLAYSARTYSPIGAHYPDGREERADLTPYIEEVAVDVGDITRQISEAFTASRAQYEKDYPTDEDKASFRRNRYSGQGYLHERDINEVIRSACERLKWQWKVAVVSIP